MEAHNGLSAKIVEEAGFDGIWASGLTIAAALGVRDNNEASWTQVLEVLGHGGRDVDSDPRGRRHRLRQLQQCAPSVRKLAQRGIAGVCIEDKLFPKTNSFLGEGQSLADIDEFCGKIKAGKDADERVSIVARVEALISGWGLDEALRRAEAYHAAVPMPSSSIPNARHRARFLRSPSSGRIGAPSSSCRPRTTRPRRTPSAKPASLWLSGEP